MGAWGRLEDTFHDEPKFYKLAAKLNITFVQAAGHMACLWSWAHRHAIDGDLRDYDNYDIARAAKWDGPVNDFVEAASDKNVRLLDRKSDFYIIHNFAIRAEARKEAKRKAKWRVSRDCPVNEIQNVPGRREEKRRDLILKTTIPEITDSDTIHVGQMIPMSHNVQLASDNIHSVNNSSKTNNNAGTGVKPEELEVTPSAITSGKLKKRLRTEEQKARSRGVRSLYVELYAAKMRQLGRDQDPRLDAEANTKLAAFADRWTDKAEAIVRAFFASSDPWHEKQNWAYRCMIARAETLANGPIAAQPMPRQPDVKRAVVPNAEETKRMLDEKLSVPAMTPEAALLELNKLKSKFAF